MLAFSLPIVSTKGIEIVWSNWLVEIECITRDGGNWSSYRVDENVSGCSTAQEIASVFLTKNSHGPRHQGKQHCQSERIRRERVAGDINIHRSSNAMKSIKKEREKEKSVSVLSKVFQPHETTSSKSFDTIALFNCAASPWFLRTGIFAIPFIV